MTTFDATRRPRLKRHGRRTVVRDRYQRAQVHDLGSKWKLFYWDYTRSPRQRRTKTWSKSRVPTEREAQRLADQFMEAVNERNNNPNLFSGGDDTLRSLYDKCRKEVWPHLKNSTRKQYVENFETYLLPKFGVKLLRKLKTVDLQIYFNLLSRRLAPKSVRLIHGTLRAALNQGRTWGLLDRNPAVGVKMPRKRMVKPTLLLSLCDIRRVVEAAKEPTKSLLVLIVFASMRVGEALALRWKDVLRDRIVIDERVYDEEFDEVKTEAGQREVPFDKHGVILGAIQRLWERNKKFRKPDDLVFANRAGNVLDRHNLLHRHIKPVAEKLGLPKGIDFRSFRTMHASLMRRVGGRFEIARDNMGHAGSTGKVTLDVYSKTWWEERVEAVTRIVEAVFTEPEEERREISTPLKAVAKSGAVAEWEPFWEPQAV